MLQASWIVSFIDFEIDTSSDDEDERILSSVLEKIDNELKEKYSYQQKLTNLDFVKETSEAGCSNVNEKGKYDNNDKEYVLSDSSDDEVNDLEDF